MVPARHMARTADGMLAEVLTTSGAVQVKGPKRCGETATSLQQAASVVYLQDPGHSASYLVLADAEPSALLEGRAPRLIDEQQTVPQLWDVARFVVDLRGESGQFVLTGSSTPVAGGACSGAGGIAPMVMRTVTLFESEDSSGRIPLQRPSDGEEEVADVAPLDIGDIIRVLCRGGWSTAVIAGVTSVPGRLARTYVEGLISSDVACMDDVSRNSTRMCALMRAYARYVSTQASQTTITADLAVNDSVMVPNTVSDYLDALSRTCVVGGLPTWNPAPRFKTVIHASPTRHLVDPSIGVAVIRWTPADLLRDFETFGLQLESLCVRDLRVYAEVIDGTLFHYRDKTGLETDIVIVLADRRWAPIRVKLGSRQLGEAATHLRLLRECANANCMGEPSFFAVITAGAAAYRRDDGVFVVPLACLRP